MLCKVRSENGYGFLRPGLKTGVGNGIFWSEIGSGLGDAGGTPPPKIRGEGGGGGAVQKGNKRLKPTNSRSSYRIRFKRILSSYYVLHVY